MSSFSSPSRPNPQVATLLSEAIERLQIAILAELTVHYTPRFSSTEAVALANCVLAYATLTAACGSEAQDYYKTHRKLVHYEVTKLSENAEVSEAFSYLYAAITLNLVIQTKSPFSDAAASLANRATELSLYIPTTYDICGSSDALECVKAIESYAHRYLNGLKDRG